MFIKVITRKMPSFPQLYNQIFPQEYRPDFHPLAIIRAVTHSPTSDFFLDKSIIDLVRVVDIEGR
jgi:hypothetical protein